MLKDIEIICSSEAAEINKKWEDVWEPTELATLKELEEEKRGTSSLGKDLDKCLDCLRQLLLRKNEDYGSAYKRRGLYGILVRIEDKLARIETLFTKKSNFESMADNWYDIAGYALLAIMLLEDKK